MPASLVERAARMALSVDGDGTQWQHPVASVK
jgi:hypothetical protein